MDDLRTPSRKRMAFSKLPSRQGGSSFRPKLLPTQSVGTLNLSATNQQPKVLIIQNDLLCNPCTAINSFISHDVQYQVVYAFHDNAFKLIHPLMFEGLVVLGGRAGVYEEPKWLKTEMLFITNALKLNLPVLGICLGCQLLAQCIGGEVYNGNKGVEIGYHPWKFTKDAKASKQKSRRNLHEEKKEQSHSNKKGNKGPQKFSLMMKNNNKPKAFGGNRLALSNFGRSRSMRYGPISSTKKTNLINLGQAPMMAGLGSFNEDKHETPTNSITLNKDKKDNKKKNKNKPRKKGVLDIDSDSDDAGDFNEDEIDFDEDDIDEEEEDEIDENEQIIDPIVKLLQPKGYDNYIILFHGDTFRLPTHCKVSKQPVTLLATTARYNTLFRVGKYSYGFQGHPELTYDMLRVWCKCWGDEFLNRWNGDLEKDVMQYAEKHQDVIKLVGQSIFDIWSRDVVLVKNQQKVSNLRTKSFKNLSIALKFDSVAEEPGTAEAPKKRSSNKKKTGFTPKSKKEDEPKEEEEPYKINKRPKDDSSEDEEEEIETDSGSKKITKQQAESNHTKNKSEGGLFGINCLKCFALT